MPFQPATTTSAHKCHACLGPIRPDAAAYMLRPSRDAYFRQQRFHEACTGALRSEFRSQLVRYRTKRPLRAARPWQGQARLKAGRRTPRPRALSPLDRWGDAAWRLVSSIVPDNVRLTFR